MKKLAILLFGLSSIFATKITPKILTRLGTIVAVSYVYESSSQSFINWRINTSDTTLEAFFLSDPSKTVIKIKDSTSYIIKVPVIFTKLAGTNSGIPSSITWIDSDGILRRSNISTIPLTSSQVTTALGYSPMSNTLSVSLSTVIAGYGTIVSGTAPSQTITVDTVAMMYTSKANTAITGINNSIGQKVSQSTTLNYIAGQGITMSPSGAQNLSTNRTWTISLAARTMSAAVRSLVTSTASTGFQISSTLDYNVNYSVFAQVTSVLVGTNTADVYLEISPNNSAPWTTISRSGISVSGVASTSGNTQTVGGFIPAGYYVRIRTAATGVNAGSAVFTYQNGQENNY